ncbi:glycoside hydrolase family 127 protein [Leifsonia poae]|uniref:glycoside hydrolase family 127 protein n=1 Tax=Leifsonia poae TaxID=110933 RepID=UPI003D674DD8
MTDIDTKQAQAPVVPSASLLSPLGLDEVRITGGYWARRQSANSSATLEHIEHWLEREGWLPNFDLAAAGRLPQDRRGREFSDSEIYKYLEALAWEIGRTGNEELDQRFTAIATRVLAAQEPDGYLNTNFGRPGQGERWSDLEWGHELYCAGHLFQAVVARQRTRPDAEDGLYAGALRFADLICDVFGTDGIQSVCGHPEVETALVELGRTAGEPRYIEQARLFVERRGTGVLRDIEWGRSYYQDDVPIREAEVLRGHAVRANYLASGAVDVAVETHDAPLLANLEGQWSRTIARRTYLTGGQGSHHQDEAFGDDFELPSDRAYSETCASIASVQFSWRMLLSRTGRSYADLIERTLHNVVATSPSQDGRAFFYANTLHRRTPGAVADTEAASPRAEASLRAPWFEVSCCPPNVARTFASLDTYLATTDAQGLQLHQFASANIATRLPDGEEIAVEVETRYPDEGTVRVRILKDASRPWTLSLRVPAWAGSARVSVLSDGGASEETSSVEADYATVTRQFAAGDTVELELPFEPRFVRPDPRVDAVRGSVAVERGPIVYALESVDLPEGSDSVDDYTLDDSIEPEFEDGRLFVHLRARRAAEREWPYQVDVDEEVDQLIRVPLVPYCGWAERGPSTMRVWLPLT